jgi:hypothetical protein
MKRGEMASAAVKIEADGWARHPFVARLSRYVELTEPDVKSLGPTHRA